MSGIFANPEEAKNDDLKVLFFHGLEGSPEGAKSTHLNNVWNAKTPMLRASALKSLRDSNPGKSWREMPRTDLDSAFDAVYDDALAAMKYLEPDVIVGSSMGGAILAKLVLDKKWQGPCVFLAPAIAPLLGDVKMPVLKNSVWILGELDTIVPNADNINHCRVAEGSLLISMGDSHRLHLALQRNLIDCAIVTSLSL